MSNRIDTKIILGPKRYQSSINNDLLINVPLDNTSKEIDEFDRDSTLSLAQLFDDERQSSSIFRLTSKIDLIFFNAYSGITGNGGTDYKPFTNNLYYINSEESFNTNNWSGYPQYVEFDLIRNDNNVLGYTKGLTGPLPIIPHVNFVNKSATTYNWTQYISYAYENDYTRILQYDRTTSNNVTWVSGDGIPFYIENPYTINGQNLISFICPVEHGLSVGEWVEINIPGWNGVNGNYTFQVYSLGQTGFNSGMYIFNIYNNGFSSNDFVNSSEGTFKRIIDINNPLESKSKYYIRKHKILTDVNNTILNKAGFDQNGFGVKRQYEYSSLTPNKEARISQKEGNQSYLLTFSKDIDISKYRDNLNRPLSELFVTIINKGYFGWLNKPFTGNIGVREGYKYNLSYNPSNYWSLTNNSVNKSTLETNSYTNGGFTFYYNKDLKSGDTLNGDYCEFNQIEQKERVISNIYHKLWFNPLLFNINKTVTTNPSGYYYNPHHSIKLRVYSDYIEEGDIKDVDGVPDYSYYSEHYKTLRWRDLYTYGFIDKTGLGVDYPFINGTHYPSTNIIFRVFPEGNVSEDIYAISDPIIDDCE